MSRRMGLQRDGFFSAHTPSHTMPGRAKYVANKFHSNRAKLSRPGTDLHCPDCGETAPTPEMMAVHLERHREMVGPLMARGKHAGVVECPEGCGRRFGVGQGKKSRTRPYEMDYYHHTATCDGSKPIPRRKA